MSEVSAEVDRFVSATAWAGFPALHYAILKWADLAPEAGLHISAVPLGMDFTSVRLTSLGESGEPRDAIEFLVPSSFRGATQAAIDHFVERSLEAAVDKLQGRAGIAEGVADSPPGPAIPDDPERGKRRMAKTKAGAKAQAQPKTGRTKSARVPIPEPVAAAPAPAPAKGRARKPAAARPAAAMAPRAETRAAPAPGPAASMKPGGKRATPAARSSKSAPEPAARPAASKPRAPGKRAK